MNAMTHTGNFGFSFAEADLDAEIAVYKADLASEAARPDFIVYSRVRGGFVYGPESGVYESNTAADIARSAPIPTPTPMPGPGDFDESDSALCGCGKPAGGWHHDMQSGTWLHLRHAFVAVAPIPTPTPMPQPGDFDDGDGKLCADCCQPCDDRCEECRINLCSVCNERWHRHGQPAGSRRNGTAFFDRQRAARAARADIIEAYFYNARAAATELHGELGDAAYSERVQDQADELFN